MEKQKLPNSTIILVLGIISILTCCCYGVLGTFSSLIALYLAKKDTALYNENPSEYDYSSLKTGKILAIIGLILNIIFIIYIIFMWNIVGGWEVLSNEELLRERLEELQNR
ncbi:MAG: DUF4190 domain-containing protein [Tenacibaculum sp.]|nr:DUF4190 domain-containing protein [Tenacibaculum sp.]